ncbi:ABC transporter ATP-binding protein [Marivita sp.]|uniref:ABC transporter ATP-binding protein n=1 Tax=Marivita sp. TaxID=2003365 RepID=UPI003F7099DE
MTSLAAYLEDFGSPASGESSVSVSDEMLESERLESFDKGYRAGWDDAIKAKAEDGAHLSDGIAQNLQDLSFTYHDVHAQVLSNLTPLFHEILQKILPSLARDTLGAHIAEQLSKIARDIGTVQIEIAVAPGFGAQVSQFVNEASSSLPISVTESTAVSEGQAELRLGAKELSIDLSDVSKQITEAVHAVLHDQSEKRAHG